MCHPLLPEASSVQSLPGCSCHTFLISPFSLCLSVLLVVETAAALDTRAYVWNSREATSYLRSQQGDMAAQGTGDPVKLGLTLGLPTPYSHQSHKCAPPYLQTQASVPPAASHTAARVNSRPGFTSVFGQALSA